MKKKINLLTAILFSFSLLLASCGEIGENAEIPTESDAGNTRETGIDGSGDLPGTAADDTTDYVNEVIGDDNAASGDSLL